MKVADEIIYMKVSIYLNKELLKHLIVSEED